MTPSQSAAALKKASLVIANLPEFSHETAEEPLRALAEELGLNAGQLFGILRAAVTGQKVSPPLFESMAIIGKQTVLDRINNAVQILDQIPE